jgi:hypothetical protein
MNCFNSKTIPKTEIPTPFPSKTYLFTTKSDLEKRRAGLQQWMTDVTLHRFSDLLAFLNLYSQNTTTTTTTSTANVKTETGEEVDNGPRVLYQMLNFSVKLPSRIDIYNFYICGKGT